MSSLDKLTQKGKQESSWDWKMLISLGVDEQKLRQANPNARQLQDLVKGVLYLKARYPSFWE